VSNKDIEKLVTCFDCENRARTEWAALNDAELGRLEQARSCRHFQAGEPIFFEGDPCDGVFCVEAGLVGVRKGDSDGNSVLLRLAAPGDTLGYRAFLGGEDHHTSAEALAGTRLCYIPRANLRDLLAENPDLGLRFLRHAAADLDDTQTKLLQSAAQTARERLLHVLLVMREQMGVVTDDDGAVTFRLPISRQDLASMIRARPETLSRTIRQMEGEGTVEFQGRMVRIPRLDALLDQIV
jgi:CRP/FNR family transcriptional regulator